MIPEQYEDMYGDINNELPTERQRGHIEPWNICDIAGEDTTLDRSTDSDILIRLTPWIHG